jgi:hypothetical protein
MLYFTKQVCRPSAEPADKLAHEDFCLKNWAIIIIIKTCKKSYFMDTGCHAHRRCLKQVYCLSSISFCLIKRKTIQSSTVKNGNQCAWQPVMQKNLGGKD